MKNTPTEQYTYIYEGPVLSFGKIYEKYWVYRTKASSAKKAIQNMLWHYRGIKQKANNFKFELDERYLRIESKERIKNA